MNITGITPAARDRATKMRWETSPAGRTWELMDALAALDGERSRGASRLHRLLGQALAVREFERELRIVHPPRFIQSLLASLADRLWSGDVPSLRLALRAQASKSSVTSS